MKTTANTTTNTRGKTFATVVFLMAQNPDTDRWEPMAYFPDIAWDLGGNKASYMHDGQHGPCCEAFALIDCIAPRRQHMAAVARLKAELEGIGYELTVIDTATWMVSKGKRKVEIENAIWEVSNNGASEKMMKANAANGAARKAKKRA